VACATGSNVPGLVTTDPPTAKLPARAITSGPWPAVAVVELSSRTSRAVGDTNRCRCASFISQGDSDCTYRGPIDLPDAPAETWFLPIRPEAGAIRAVRCGLKPPVLTLTSFGGATVLASIGRVMRAEEDVRFTAVSRATRFSRAHSPRQRP
jgi:hypothetical protein